MIRTIALAAVIASLSTSAFAGHHYSKKLCQATDLKGKSVTFVCKASEVCCYNKLIGKSSCGKNALSLGSKKVCM